MKPDENDEPHCDRRKSVRVVAPRAVRAVQKKWKQITKLVAREKSFRYFPCARHEIRQREMLQFVRFRREPTAEILLVINQIGQRDDERRNRGSEQEPRAFAHRQLPRGDHDRNREQNLGVTNEVCRAERETYEYPHEYQSAHCEARSLRNDTSHPHCHHRPQLRLHVNERHERAIHLFPRCREQCHRNRGDERVFLSAARRVPLRNVNVARCCVIINPETSRFL